LGASDRRKPGGAFAGRDRRRTQRRTGEDRRRKGGRQSGDERRSGQRRQSERRTEDGWAAVPIEPATESRPDRALVAAAIEARRFAQCRYSGFQVGAALETPHGLMIGGCNIENATYGLTVCAERVALLKALSDGHTVFTRIAVVTDTDDPTPPCGACRQLLWEYCGDLEVILANLNRTIGRYRLSALLPLPFDRRLLE